MLVAVESSILEKILEEGTETKQIVKEKAMLDTFTEILDTDQACDYLKLSKRTIQLLRDKGELNSVNTGREYFTNGQNWKSLLILTGLESSRLLIF
jgi:excisionase family DNA binding protein